MFEITSMFPRGRWVKCPILHRIIWFPQCCWCNPNEYWQINYTNLLLSHTITTTQSFAGLYYRRFVYFTHVCRWLRRLPRTLPDTCNWSCRWCYYRIHRGLAQDSCLLPWHTRLSLRRHTEMMVQLTLWLFQFSSDNTLHTTSSYLSMIQGISGASFYSMMDR